jgi:hypothetical protein
MKNTTATDEARRDRPREIVDAAVDPREAQMRDTGDAWEEVAEGGERLRVDVLVAPDGRYAYRAVCGYDACDGVLRDTTIASERFATAEEARVAGMVKARQLAGLDVPEA